VSSQCILESISGHSLNRYSLRKNGVVKVGEDDKAGRYVKLYHEDCVTVYCHLSEIYKTTDDSVIEGEMFAKSGNTDCRPEHISILD